jgi:3-hydroxyisobutyrate dehydrogenase
MNIGYIGLGALGRELARTFLPHHDLSVWDVNTEACAALEKLGVRVASSAADLARTCDVVLLCLPRSSDVRQVVFGADGLAEGLSQGMLVIDQTSGVPGETRAMAQELAAQGVAMMDAPVSASPHIVAQGGAVLMAAGPDDVFERALPLLRVITKTVYRCGNRVGDGQAMKMVNNAMNAGCRIGTLEIVALGRKAGLSLGPLTDALNMGAARNQTTVKMLPAIAEGKSSTNFALSLQLKDINQAVSLGMEIGVPMPITNVVHGLLQIGANTLGKDARLEDMVGLMESMASIRFAQPNQDSDSLVDCGGVGSAHLTKLIDNAVSSLCRLVTYECVAVGVKYGLRLDKMAEVLNNSSGWSAASQQILPILGLPVPSANIQMQPMIMDLRLAAGIAMVCGAPMLISNAVRSMFELAGNELGGTASIDAMAGLYETMAGISFNAARDGS